MVCGERTFRYNSGRSAMNTFSIGPAAGVVKYRHDLPKYLRSAATHLVLGSFTPTERAGNHGQVYYRRRDGTSINAFGLNNEGRLNLRPHLKDLLHEARRHHKHLTVSVSGDNVSTPEELAAFIAEILEAGLDVEFNASCPNVRNADGSRKRILSEDPERLAEVLYIIARTIPHGTAINLKISPVPDEIMSDLAAVITDSIIVRALAGINTFPDQEILQDDDQTPALAYRVADDPSLPILHKGGMAGTALRPHALRVLEGMRRRLPERMPIISVGGISTGADILERWQMGAAGVQFGTACYENGPRALSDAFEELGDYAIAEPLIRSIMGFAA